MKKVNPVEFAKAIADETRQKIMGLCCCDELSVNEIVEQTNVSQPTVSHHLAILREAGSGGRAARGQAGVLHAESRAHGDVLRTVDAGLCAGERSD